MEMKLESTSQSVACEDDGQVEGVCLAPAAPTRRPGSSQRSTAITLEAPHACRVCGELARVHVLERYHRGRPVWGRLCLRCADTAAGAVSMRRRRRGRVAIAVLAACSGTAMGLVGVLARILVPAQRAALDWYALFGAVVAGALLIAAVRTRSAAVALGGALLSAGLLGAEWLDLAGARSVDWGQRARLGTFALLLLVALVSVVLVLRSSAATAREVAESGESLTSTATS